ncbi:hypothetical protein A5888_001931 [Enterococcus sp. 9E7_DIV0242]|uniref:Uncharacterized protein n=1 Tax=Candidatus Enterococcus clewellii TaxID=1834193 RepID=A0A242K333_9ENTE|nr:hypothetical protein A5888_002884 [Enterococcus sp. 9E7_DIV0242]
MRGKLTSQQLTVLDRMDAMTATNNPFEIVSDVMNASTDDLTTDVYCSAVLTRREITQVIAVYLETQKNKVWAGKL